MLTLKEITKSYGTGDGKCEALKGIDLTVADGEFAVILGASGSGKSTLLHVMSGLERPDGGSVLYDGKDIATLTEKQRTAFRKDTVGFVFQQYYLLPGLTVDKNVRMGADLAGNKAYRAVIEAVGLSGKEHKRPAELSGGEQQRVSIARALAKNPKVLFLDEPTGALDEQTGRQILDYLLRLHRERKFTMVMVTHNENIAQTADAVIRMGSGKVCEKSVNASPASAWEIGW